MRKILYCEDNMDTADAVKILLSNVGYEVHLVHRGEHCMKLAKAAKYDLILLDIGLPDMSGLDIFDSLKEEIDTRYALISINPPSNEKLNQMKKDGLSDFIKKPFTKEELISKIHSIMK
jgi:DNA-binding response OmpR family regulator